MKKTIQMLLIATGLVFAFTGDAVAKEKTKKSKSKVKVVSVTLTKDNTLSLRHAFYRESVGNLVQKAHELDARLESKDPLFLVLRSPGGSISAGLNGAENLRNINRPIHTISLFAASMGFETVQALGKRLIPVDGTLMAHKGWFYWGGEYPGQFDNRYSWMLKRSERMAKRTVARTKGKHTMKSYAALIENEYWCDGVDCIEQGFADYIVRAKCDKSLAGTHVEPIWQFMFFGHVIELKVQFPDCPLNSGYLAYDIYIDGQPLYGNIKGDSKEEVVRFNNIVRGYYDQPDKQIFTNEQLLEIKKKTQEVLDTLDSRKVVLAP